MENLSAVSLKPTERLVNRLRRIKSPEEPLALIREAVAITDRAWAQLSAELVPGKTETEIAAAFEYIQRKLGAEGASFSTIVAPGPRSVLPHGAPGARRLSPGDLVVVDGGALYGVYCSDFTRTIVVGEPTPRQLELYNLVREAQEAALADTPRDDRERSRCSCPTGDHQGRLWGEFRPWSGV